MSLKEINRLWRLWWEWAETGQDEIDHRTMHFKDEIYVDLLWSAMSGDIIGELPNLLLELEISHEQAYTQRPTFSRRLRYYLRGSMYPLENVV